MKKDFLSIADLTSKEILGIFEMAKKLKKEVKKGIFKKHLENKALALVFEKQSLRTRISFEIGTRQLGGDAVYLDPRDTGIGVRESNADVARILSGMTDMIAARTYDHQMIIDIAQSASVPVINALSDYEHPCQALTDLFTLWEIKGSLKDLKMSFVGDGENNVTHSLCLGATIVGMTFHCASPNGYWMDLAITTKARQFGTVFETQNPIEAVSDADVVVTDTWISMGDSNKKERLKIFQKYQVNNTLMKYAKKDAVFMHCLPAYRGNEVSAQVIDGPQSVVFQEAENRLHVQKALMLFLLDC